GYRCADRGSGCGCRGAQGRLRAGRDSGAECDKEDPVGACPEIDLNRVEAVGRRIELRNRLEGVNPIPAAQNHRRRNALSVGIRRKHSWRNVINDSGALRNGSAVASNGDRRGAVGHPRRDQIVDLIRRDEESPAVRGLIVRVFPYPFRTAEQGGQRKCSRECGSGGRAGTETRHDAIGGQRDGRGKTRRRDAGELTEWSRSWSWGRRWGRGWSWGRGRSGGRGWGWGWGRGGGGGWGRGWSGGGGRGWGGGWGLESGSELELGLELGSGSELESESVLGSG